MKPAQLLALSLLAVLHSVNAQGLEGKRCTIPGSIHEMHGTRCHQGDCKDVYPFKWGACEKGLTCCMFVESEPYDASKVVQDKKLMEREEKAALKRMEKYLKEEAQAEKEEREEAERKKKEQNGEEVEKVKKDKKKEEKEEKVKDKKDKKEKKNKKDKSNKKDKKEEETNEEL